ncbi:hypothetical protein TrLO_g1600 [Triparma laevis f. longispina]|uniref:Uncharacterized protein n=1 Tax=Triparma laevis f. longispina TaxID=1714387 RepID=A0A9W7CCN1_9STRA|nr:hypothetical protein TrLO_g1600 [Triparma laevis f. longispina]
MTLLPSLLYMIMEILVWRAKRRWATVAVEDVNTQGESDENDDDCDADENDGADEENPVEEVKSPVHRHQTDNDDDDNDDDSDDDDKKVVVSVENPSMIKNPSSRPPVPVSTIIRKLEAQRPQ